MMATDLHVTTLSLPEAQALVTRAARGAGHAWGVADECGWAAIWLARQGLDWADIVLECLSDPGSANLTLAEGRWTGEAPLCPLRTGIALSDFAGLPQGPRDGLTIGPLAHPLMILPFGARAAASLECTLDILHENRAVASCSANATRLAAPDLAGPVTLVIRPSDTPLASRRDAQDAPLTPAQKARLDALAGRTFVPSSARSEAGAGSEKSDND